MYVMLFLPLNTLYDPLCKLLGIRYQDPRDPTKHIAFRLFPQAVFFVGRTIITLSQKSGRTLLIFSTFFFESVYSIFFNFLS